MKLWISLVFCLLVTAFGASKAARAEESDFYGLLRSRDLTPFGFLRLDMRPAHAVAIEPGSWAFETELGYQNTWALSLGGRALPDASKRRAGATSGRRTCRRSKLCRARTTCWTSSPRTST